MYTFRILHLSDFHFSDEPGTVHFIDRFRSQGAPPRMSRNHISLLKLTSHDENLAAAVAQWAWREGPQVDMTLITGDLATTGSQKDLDAALRFITSPAHDKWMAADGRPTLQGGENPIRLLPGNHDRYGQQWWAAGDDTFDDVFGDYWKIKSRTQLLAQLHDQTTNERLAIVAADFCLFNNADAKSGKYDYMGQGKAYAHLVEDLKRLTASVRKNADGPVAVVWVVHFAPMYAMLPSVLQLIDDDYLLQAAADSKVEHIFCGHTHHAKVYTPCGFPTVLIHCAGAACQAWDAQGNTFHLRDINVHQGKVVSVDHVDFVWNDDAGGYRRVAGRERKTEQGTENETGPNKELG